MNLEQVKKHFKNAKTVRCPYDSKIFNLNAKGCFKEEGGGDIYFRFNKTQYTVNDVFLYYGGELAEIISYKKEENEYPKVMLVSMDERTWSQRVVFLKKNEHFIAWNNAKTIEEAKSSLYPSTWKYAKELPKEIKVTKEEIAKWKGCEVEQLIIK